MDLKDPSEASDDEYTRSLDGDATFTHLDEDGSATSIGDGERMHSTASDTIDVGEKVLLVDGTFEDITDISPLTDVSDGSTTKRGIRLKRFNPSSMSSESIVGGKLMMNSEEKGVFTNISISKNPEEKTIFDNISVNESVVHETVGKDELKFKDISPSKTIIISPYPIHSETTEDESELANIVDNDEGLKSAVNIITASETARRKPPETSKLSAVPPSPYNTRFAHMKIGKVFPISNRSNLSRKKFNKDIFKPVLDNSSDQDVTKGAESDKDTRQNKSGVCFLCGIPFANDMGVSLSVKKPLPLSKVSLTTLLDSFSISSLACQSVNHIGMCNICHTLVIDGDAAYKQILSIASEMREQWPSRAVQKNPVFTLIVPDIVADISEESDNQGGERESKNEMLTLRKEAPPTKKTKGKVGRPPKIRIKQEEEDVNWKPSQIKTSKSTHTGRRGRPPKRKIKHQKRGRPRKVMIKGEASDEEAFTCGLCSQSFHDEGAWGIHYEMEHKTQLRWINYRTQKKLKKLILMNIQESFLNEDFNDITCHACDSNFSDKNSFIEHLRDDHKMLIDDDFLSALYNFSQGNVENTDAASESEVDREFQGISHRNIIKMEKDPLIAEVKCKVCNLILEDEKKLKEHTSTNHFNLVVISNDDTKEVVLPDEKPNVKKITQQEIDHLTSPKDTNKENIESLCDECEQAFESRHEMLEHKLNFHGSYDDKGQEKGLVRYECEVCGRRIYGMAALKVHMTKVHYRTACNFKFNCDMCVFKSQSRSQLGKHMRNKHGKEIMPTVQCETCGKMYGASYIGKHIATMHSTHQRNFECNFCDMKFYDMAGLKFHIYHEHANKVWKCNKCNVEFKKYHQLRQHRIFVHSTKVHACTECPKTYKRKSDLTEHVKRLHLQRVVLLCPRCPKQYVNRFKLRHHLMKHHDVPWEDTLARNYARHQRANNCRRTEEGVLEASKDQPRNEESSILIQEAYETLDNQKGQEDNREGMEVQGGHEYQTQRFTSQSEYSPPYRQSNEGYLEQHPLKIERHEEPEEYIEIMEATDSFAKEGITYVIIEEA